MHEVVQQHLLRLPEGIHPPHELHHLSRVFGVWCVGGLFFSFVLGRQQHQLRLPQGVAPPRQFQHLLRSLFGFYNQVF